MSKRYAAFLIEDIPVAIGKIREYTTGIDRDGFVSSGMAADADDRIRFTPHRL